MTSFDLPIKPWPSRFYIYVINSLVQHMPMELTLKLRAVVGLDSFRPKRQPKGYEPNASQILFQDKMRPTTPCQKRKENMVSRCHKSPSRCPLTTMVEP